MFFYIITIYILLAFVLLRLVIPHLGFKEDSIPERIPESMLAKINEIKNQSGGPEQFLNLAYDYLGSRFRSERLNTILKLDYLYKSPEQAWQMNGYLPCTISNYLLKIFLVKSDFFRLEDIKARVVFLNFVPHQYLQVKVNGRWLDVDVGKKQCGIPLGGRKKYFG